MVTRLERLESVGLTPSRKVAIITGEEIKSKVLAARTWRNMTLLQGHTDVVPLQPGETWIIQEPSYNLESEVIDDRLVRVPRMG